MRRTNLIIHGLIEPAQSINDNRDRMEADRRLCGELLTIIGARTRGQDLRFCRRVGERGRDPRPIVIGIRTEEERRFILDRARLLQGTRFDNVSIVPDLTKMQRRAEDQLASEAELKNRSLTAEDNERNLRWLVVGRRGEKRLIKGVEHPPQRDRRRPQLGDYMRNNVRSGNINGGGGGGSSGGGGSDGGGRERDYANELAVGTRRRDNYPPLQPPNTAPQIPQPRLLDPIHSNGEQYTPQQHRPEERRQAHNGGGPSYEANGGSGGNNWNSGGGYTNNNNRGYGQAINNSSGHSGSYRNNGSGYNSSANGGGYNSNTNGGGFGNNGYSNQYGSNRVVNNNNGYRSPPWNGNNGYSNEYGNNRGYNLGNNGGYNHSSSGYRSPPRSTMQSNGSTQARINTGDGNGGTVQDNPINNGGNTMRPNNTTENWSQIGTDRPAEQPPAAGNGTLGRPRLGSKRLRDNNDVTDPDQRMEEGPPRTRRNMQL
jgi:hypothetical protein